MSSTPFRIDRNTITEALQGTLRWALYPPGAPLPSSAAYSVAQSLSHWLNTTYPSVTRGLTGPKPIEFVQRAGELLYVPEGWYQASMVIEDVEVHASISCGASTSEHANDSPSSGPDGSPKGSAHPWDECNPFPRHTPSPTQDSVRRTDLVVAFSYQTSTNAQGSYYHYMLEGDKRLHKRDSAGAMRLYKLGLSLCRDSALLLRLAKVLDIQVQNKAGSTAVPELEEVRRELIQRHPFDSSLYSALVDLFLSSKYQVRGEKDVTALVGEVLQLAETRGIKEQVLELAQHL